MSLTARADHSPPLPRRHPGSAGSILSIGSAGSILSVGSVGSILSIGSAGCVLSIGSAGSILSVGSVGSILSIGSAGSILSIRSAGAIQGRDARRRAGGTGRHGGDGGGSFIQIGAPRRLRVVATAFLAFGLGL
jgi:hypothetical protein